MEKKVLFFLAMFVLIASLFLAGSAQACPNRPCACGRTIDPIVETDWLFDNLNQDNLVIVDIRPAAAYEIGHIEGSINKEFPNPFATEWVVSDFEGLWLEVPQTEALFETIGSLGIRCNSRVVIVTASNLGEPPYYGLANATRVALTLIYAGVKNVAILDGGYPKWVADGGTFEKGDSPEVTPVKYKGKLNKSIFVSADYVKKHIRKADIIDARDADVYFGVTIEPFADKAGHIPNAKSLPAPWIWDLEGENYFYKDTETLSAMAYGVIREPWGWKAHLRQEIIVYCGVGGYASSWWFALTQVLGYENVKLYDGSAQEWVRYYDMVPYQWD
jgi:thiosulfate/3-mercaptopyruvate sulfurtransferase